MTSDRKLKASKEGSKKELRDLKHSTIQRVPASERAFSRSSLKLSPSDSHIFKTVSQALCSSDRRSRHIATKPDSFMVLPQLWEQFFVDTTTDEHSSTNRNRTMLELEVQAFLLIVCAA